MGNMLIAVMTKSVEEMDDCLLSYYASAQAELVLSFVDSSIIPPPLNALSLPYHVLNTAWHGLQSCLSRRGRRKGREMGVRREKHTFEYEPRVEWSESAAQKLKESAGRHLVESLRKQVPETHWRTAFMERTGQ